MAVHTVAFSYRIFILLGSHNTKHFAGGGDLHDSLPTTSSPWRTPFVLANFITISLYVWTQCLAYQLAIIFKVRRVSERGNVHYCRIRYLLLSDGNDIKLRRATCACVQFIQISRHAAPPAPMRSWAKHSQSVSSRSWICGLESINYPCWDKLKSI